MNVTVRSGMNRFEMDVSTTTTIRDLYEMVKLSMNLPDTENLNVVVDGETHEYSSVSYENIEPGTVVEFVKSAGTKQ